MLLDHVLRLFWICLLLFVSSGSGFPYQVKVPQGVDGESGLGQFYGGAGHSFYKPSTGKYYDFGGVKDSSGSDDSDSDVPKAKYYGSGGLGSGSVSGSSGSGSSGSGSGSSGSSGSGSGSSGSGSGGSSDSGSATAGSGTSSKGSGVSSLPFYVVNPQDFDLSQLKLPLFPFNDHWLYPDVPIGTIPEFLQQPSIRLVQNSNDYQRAKSVAAHTKYTQDDWDILPFVGNQDQGGQSQDDQDSQDQGRSKNQRVKG